MKHVEVVNVSKSYGKIRALKDVSFSVAKGEILGLLGPNGAGKTTLMKVICGFLSPDSGEAVVFGSNMEIDPQAGQAKIGYLPEHVPLYLDMTVENYLSSVVELRGIARKERGNAIERAIRDTGLEGHFRKRIRHLSKGFRQRVGIAQAIVHRPELLILDEPTTGLDPNQIVEIRELIKLLAKESTVILSTHILSEVEATCQKVLIIDEGQVKADGTIEELTHTVGDQKYSLEIRSPTDPTPIIEGWQLNAKIEAFGADIYKIEISSHEGGHLGEKIYELCRASELSLRQLTTKEDSLESVFQTIAGGRS